MLQEHTTVVDCLLRDIRHVGAVNVNNAGLKERVIAAGRDFFERIRPNLIEMLSEADLSEIDGVWQNLIRLAHMNNSKKTYVRNLSWLRNKLSDANTALLSRRINKTTNSKSHSTEEMLLLSTLESLVPSAAASYRQALDDLQSSEKVSFKGTSAELREAFREVIDKLAPDDEVVKQDGFKLEDGRSKPTQKQKVRFILKARKEKSARMIAAEKATQVVEEFTGEFARAVYDSASLSTHTQAAREDILKLKRYINAVLFDILQISEPS